jgi:hypothetical protein
MNKLPAQLAVSPENHYYDKICLSNCDDLGVFLIAVHLHKVVGKAQPHLHHFFVIKNSSTPTNPRFKIDYQF